MEWYEFIFYTEKDEVPYLNHGDIGFYNDELPVGIKVKMDLDGNIDFEAGVEGLGYDTDDIKDYEVKELWSYGTYDKTTLNNLYDKKFKIDIPFYDITSTLQNRIVNKRYIKFCEDNGYINVKQNIPLYTLETVYRYIFDKEFQQEHTGLSDCLAEYEILCNVFKQKQKAILSGGTQLWKRFLEFTKNSQKND